MMTVWKEACWLGREKRFTVTNLRWHPSWPDGSGWPSGGDRGSPASGQDRPEARLDSLVNRDESLSKLSQRGTYQQHQRRVEPLLILGERLACVRFTVVALWGSCERECGLEEISVEVETEKLEPGNFVISGAVGRGGSDLLVGPWEQGRRAESRVHAGPRKI